MESSGASRFAHETVTLGGEDDSVKRMCNDLCEKDDLSRWNLKCNHKLRCKLR